MKSINKGAWLVVAVLGVVAIGAIVAATVYEKPVVVSNFDECVAAGGTRMESYPEQCMYDKKTYVNENQVAPALPVSPADRPPIAPSDNKEYIGLTEDEALLRAEKYRTPARVVERDGESLPVTMDFVFGRLNFYIKDNQVYKYEVEGEGQDSPMNAE